MSEQPATGSIPRWDVADRLRKALRSQDLGVEEMADYLRVSRTSVSNWINGRIEPSDQTLRLWALRTGTPFTWLCHGDLNPCDLRPRGLSRDVSAGQGRAGRRSYNMQKMPTRIWEAAS